MSDIKVYLPTKAQKTWTEQRNKRDQKQVLVECTSLGPQVAKLGQQVVPRVKKIHFRSK